MNLSRRDLFGRLLGLLTLPIILKTTGCGSDDDGGTANPTPTPTATPTGTATPTATGGADSFVAMNTDGTHAHTITVQCSQLTEAGATVQASGSGHMHFINLTQDQLTRIANGEQVEVMTDDLHPHTWLFSKPAAACG